MLDFSTFRVARCGLVDLLTFRLIVCFRHFAVSGRLCESPCAPHPPGGRTEVSWHVGAAIEKHIVASLHVRLALHALCKHVLTSVGFCMNCANRQGQPSCSSCSAPFPQPCMAHEPCRTRRNTRSVSWAVAVSAMWAAAPTEMTCG